jgi:peptide deformylase
MLFKKPKVIITIEEFLEKKSSDVDVENDLLSIKKKVKEMVQTAMSSKKCVGLAANQIGYLDRIFIMNREGQWCASINPQIISRSKERKQAMEFCLSRPFGSKVKRHVWVIVEHTILNEKGGVETRREKFKGKPARIVQHEMDHFEGRLI